MPQSPLWEGRLNRIIQAAGLGLSLMFLTTKEVKVVLGGFFGVEKYLLVQGVISG
jgi:hypothetical protein